MLTSSIYRSWLIIDALAGEASSIGTSCLSSTGPPQAVGAGFSTTAPRTASISIRAGMIDRPDRHIESGAAAAGRHRQGDADGKNEGPLPYRSRSRCVLGLGSVLPLAGRNFVIGDDADIFISMSWLGVTPAS
jgi:hypothetical protein